MFIWFFYILISSILCGLSQEMWHLIVFRAVQGIGAAALQATSAALLQLLSALKIAITH
ncbi:hypothetical protein ACT7CZ_09545 [Bacillus cereus]